MRKAFICFFLYLLIVSLFISSNISISPPDNEVRKLPLQTKSLIEKIYTVDRIVDGEVVVLLQKNDETIIEYVALSEMPDGVAEGARVSLLFSNKGHVKEVRMLERETTERKIEVKETLEHLRKSGR
ncbi:DUF3006 domain-containing protein [Bacillus shivajii]|uniref:DUF3006 family protein n=1 Tax=Bacillus shivajii TaxID=1983719 RepID=UPI001CFA1A98|nr:DUF3006 family protein [Bacillus shivajii]UCZ53938.1 DUF3006 domain-containing protein [Bacillus shivajii]